MTTRAQHRQAARAARRSPAAEPPNQPNRMQRRAMAWKMLPRSMRRNLHGRGRWRRPITVTTGRYAFPFANRLDD